MKMTTKERIESNITIKSSTNCWEWNLYKSEAGYGIIKHNGKVKKAHRVSYEEYIGKLSGYEVLHHACHNKKCVNPKHLQPISQRENIADMYLEKYYLERIKELELRVKELEEEIAKQN